MNIFWHVLRMYVPASVKKKKLEELCTLTADAFQCSAPEISGLAYREALTRYASFTRDKTIKAIESGEDVAALKNRLYRNAWRLGGNIREDFKIKNLADVMAVSRILYRILGIDFRGNRKGEVEIRKCFFSPFYSGQICRIISSLDEGMLAGLSDGGRLSFEQRITEGKDCCRALLSLEENPE
ncbi:MAG: hypothetical protein JXB23_15360 [Candidatus Aminicenantes bacterium]|nr:hypothetical protein [Candidatus Aminicenantes bacterium]